MQVWQALIRTFGKATCLCGRYISGRHDRLVRRWKFIYCHGGIWVCSRLALAGRRPLPLPSDVDLHRDFDGVVDLDPEIPHRALDLTMSEEKLNRTQIAGLAIYQDGLRSAQRVRPELQRIKADARHPVIDEPCILPGCKPTQRILATKQNLTRLPACQPQIVIEGGLVA